MRKILRYLFLLSLMALLIVIWINPMAWWSVVKSKNYYTDKDARSSITYLLNSSQWIHFNIPSFTNKIRFIFTANLLENINTLENIPNINYSVSYYIIDDNGKVLLSKVHHLRASYLSFMDENNTFIQKNFYLKSNLKPTTNENIFIDLLRFPTASKIYLKLNDKENRIADVTMRSYHLESIPKHRQQVKWERLSKKKQEYVSRGNIYQISLMTRREKNLIVSSIWKPNGPIGIEGESYHTRRMFTLKDSDTIHPYVVVKPNIYADINLSATRYLQEGNYTIKIISLEEKFPTLLLKSYNHTQKIAEKFYKFNKKETNIDFTKLEDGIVELESNQSIEIKIFEKKEKLEMHLPALHAYDYYDINQTTPIRYRFHTPNERYIQLECYSNTEINSTLHIEMKNKKGENIKTIHHRVEMLSSRYDYRDIFTPMSQPSLLTMLVSSEVDTIDISSQTPLILRLASRSPMMPYPLYSFSKKDQPEYIRQSSWFSLRPENFTKIHIKERKVKFYKQPKPPQINPFIQSGLFDYEQLFPTHSWRGYALLLKRKLGNEAIRSQAWSSLYSQVNLSKKEPIVFHDKNGLRKITPQLFYKNLNPISPTLNLYSGNRLITKQKLHKPSGSLILPNINTNTPYHLDINTSQTNDFYLSHTADGSQQYIKRTFLTFDKPLAFQVEKGATTASIGMQLASPYKLDKILSFLVEINHLNDVKNQTINKRTYKKYLLFADNTYEKVLNITNPKQELHASDMLYLTLGENLVNGKYTVTVYPPKVCQHCYLFVNHVTLGKKSKIQLSKEKL